MEQERYAVLKETCYTLVSCAGKDARRFQLLEPDRRWFRDEAATLKADVEAAYNEIRATNTHQAQAEADLWAIVGYIAAMDEAKATAAHQELAGHTFAALLPRVLRLLEGVANAAERAANAKRDAEERQ